MAAGMLERSVWRGPKVRAGPEIAVSKNVIEQII